MRDDRLTPCEADLARLGYVGSTARLPAIMDVNQVPPRGCNLRGRGTQTSEVRMHDQSSLWPAHAAEEWRPVPGLEGRYDVSSQGRVRSWAAWRKRPGPDPRILTQKVLPKRGYRFVDIGSRRRFVHRLVLEAFVGPCPPGYQGAHLNGVRDDNRLENLRWVTPVENASHQVAHGTRRRGELMPAAKLTAPAVQEIRAAVAGGERMGTVALRHGSRTHPERVARGERHSSRTRPDRVPRGDAHPWRLHPERVMRGSAHPNAKLTEVQVREIRAAAAAGERCPALAARYGVSSGLIWKIVRRIAWTAVPE